MILVTQCPDCHATFRLTAVQLHAHNGDVRCGQCRQVFNGFLALITVPEAYIQSVAISAQPAPDQFPSVTKAVLSSAEQSPPADHFGIPLPSEKKDSRPWLAINMLLLALLLGQVVHAYRTEIFVAFPALQPLLRDYCHLVQCEIDLPRHLHLLSLESSDLRISSPAEPDVVVLTAIIRNHAPFPQELPALLLTITGTGEQPLASRVFTARDYLVDSAAEQSIFSGESEIQARCFLNTGDVGAIGYQLELIYP